MKILFFSPHAGIWQHAFPEALVADASRAEIVYVTCDGAFASGCVTMAAHGATTDEARRKVCAQCKKARDALRIGFGFRGDNFDQVLDSSDEARITKLLEGVSPSSISALEIDGIAIGRTALYEFLIERKKLALALTDEEWSVFRPRLANVLRSLTAATRILDREKPDRVVVYNSLYGVNAAWRAAAQQRGIPFYFVHGGLSLKNRLQRAIVGEGSTLDWWTRVVAAWPGYRDIPCSNTELGHVTDHFLQLFRGTSVFAYSAPKSSSGHDIRAKFGVRPGQKLVVATMSSYDEYVAAAAVGGAPDPSTMLFPTQVAWARWLIDWARTRPDCFILLRVHPREFPNKREGRKSEHAQALERELAALPDNVRVNWPADELSIYDVAEQTDAVLNAWSSAGREMALLGIPVVTFCPQALLYPADLNFVGKTHDDYAAAIDAALASGWSFDRVRAAYRWCVLELVRGLVDISDAFDWDEDRPTSPVSRLRHLALAQPAIRYRHDLIRRPTTLREQPRIAELFNGSKLTLLDTQVERRPVDEAAETQALKLQIRRLMQGLYREPATPTPGTLRARLAAVAL